MFGVTASAVLRSFPSARALSLCPANVLAEILSQTSRGRFGKAKAEYLIGLAKDSIGTQSIALELELQMLLQQIDLFTAQIAGYEAAIKSIMEEIDSPITTIPGIGYVLGAVILSEIGDISRFSRMRLTMKSQAESSE